MPIIRHNLLRETADALMKDLLTPKVHKMVCTEERLSPLLTDSPSRYNIAPSLPASLRARTALFRAIDGHPLGKCGLCPRDGSDGLADSQFWVVMPCCGAQFHRLCHGISQEWRDNRCPACLHVCISFRVLGPMLVGWLKPSSIEINETWTLRTARPDVRRLYFWLNAFDLRLRNAMAGWEDMPG